MNLAMKPGKPVTLGTLRGAIWLGLQCNPVAAFVGWTKLSAPVARALAGLADPAPAPQVARLAGGVRHRPRRCAYRPARHAGRDAQGLPLVACLPDPGAHRVARLAAADGLVLIPSDATDLAAGDKVGFLPFE